MSPYEGDFKVNERIDSDGYPTEQALEKITEWPANDIRGCFAFLGSLWNWPEYFVAEENPDEGYLVIRVSTGGWNGNEDLIGALHENHLIWTLTWFASVRGGHHTFKIPKDFL
jgi:hypothetical protein